MTPADSRPGAVGAGPTASGRRLREAAKEAEGFLWGLLQSRASESIGSVRLQGAKWFHERLVAALAAEPEEPKVTRFEQIGVIDGLDVVLHGSAFNLTPATRIFFERPLPPPKSRALELAERLKDAGKYLASSGHSAEACLCSEAGEYIRERDREGK